MSADIVVFSASAAEHLLGETILIGICVLMCGYLLAALLWPEKF
jgi:K+-transporting ATPase KdpF subunit